MKISIAKIYSYILCVKCVVCVIFSSALAVQNIHFVLTQNESKDQGCIPLDPPSPYRLDGIKLASFEQHSITTSLSSGGLPQLRNICHFSQCGYHRNLVFGEVPSGLLTRNPHSNK